jgi:type VI secretion system protein ImpB
MVMSDSGQKFIKRNRKPRVHITYEDPYDAEKLVELPFVMGVLADLSGNASKVEKPEVGSRKFLNIDMDNFGARMASIEPALNMRVDNKLSGAGAGDMMGVNLTFKSMDDFKPGQVAKQVPALAKLLEARDQLKNLQRYMDGKVDAETKLKELLNDPSLMSALAERAAEKPAGDPPKSDDGKQ